MSSLQVIEGSREVIDLKFGFGDPSFLHHQQDTADKLGKSITDGGLVETLGYYTVRFSGRFPVFLTFLSISVLSVSGVNLESADAQEIGITYEMMQVRECSWQ